MAVVSKNPEGISAPGDTLAELLAEHGLSIRELSERIDISICYLEDILDGKERISLKLADGLQKVFTVDREFWIKRDRNYWTSLGK